MDGLVTCETAVTWRPGDESDGLVTIDWDGIVGGLAGDE